MLRTLAIGALAAALVGMSTGCVIVKDRSGGDRDGRRRSAASHESREAAATDIGRVLDSLHDAASKADGLRYFELFSEDAVFIGTDAGERWPIAEFRTYAMERFNTGKGWTYAVTARHIHVDRRGRIAWFDEMLENVKYGVCRGSGVLVHTPLGWRIAQYNLSVPIPNDLLEGVAEQIRRAAAQP